MNKKYRLDVIAPEPSNSEGARDKKAPLMSHAIYVSPVGVLFFGSKV